MKVILLQELKGKGGEGDVVDVPPVLPTTTCSRRGCHPRYEGQPEASSSSASTTSPARREPPCRRRQDQGNARRRARQGRSQVGRRGSAVRFRYRQMIADAIKAATDVDVRSSPHRAGPRHQDGRPARGDHLAVPRHQDDGEAVRRRRGRRGRSCRGRGCRGDDRGSRRGSRRGDRRGR